MLNYGAFCSPAVRLLPHSLAPAAHHLEGRMGRHSQDMGISVLTNVVGIKTALLRLDRKSVKVAAQLTAPVHPWGQAKASLGLCISSAQQGHGSAGPG